MGDLIRRTVEISSDLVAKDPALVRQAISIKIDELELKLKQFEIDIERLQTVNLKKLLHEKDKTKKLLEIEKQKFDQVIIPVEVSKK